MTRRAVRASGLFFDELDRQLRPERGPNGQPSATDFLVMELPAVVERFATAFDDLPRVIDGFDQARMVIGTGLLVRTFAVYGIAMDDGAIELIGLEVDLDW